MTRHDAPGRAGSVAAPFELAPASSPLSPLLASLAAEPVVVQEQRGYRDTLREICHQPATWQITARDMARLGPQLTAFLADAGFDPQFGARPLKRTIQNLVQNPLARQVLAGEVPDGSTVIVDAGKEGIAFRKK